MDDELRLGEPFAIPDLWANPPPDLWSPPAYSEVADVDSPIWRLISDTSSESQLNLASLPSLKIPKLRFPSLDNFSFEPLEDLGSLESSSASFSDVIPEPEEIDEEDIWSTPEVLSEEKVPQRIRCWEDFQNEALRPPQSSYRSESGPETFDALLSSISAGCTKDANGSSERILKRDAVAASLVQLGLGKESVLYRYDGPSQSFQTRFANVRPSGHSMELFSSLESCLVEHGNRLKLLKSFIDHVSASTKPNRSLVSVASCVRAILHSLAIALDRMARRTDTLLQLQALLQGPFRILASLQEFIKSIPPAPRDEQVLSLLYQSAISLEDWGWMRVVAFEMLAMVARPWLDSVRNWLGLSLEKGFHDTTNSVAFIRAVEVSDDSAPQRPSNPLFEMDESGVPEFISVEEATKIFEIGQSLRMLRRHQPQHPLVLRSLAAQTYPVSVDLRSSSADIENIQAQAEKYQADLLFSIRKFDCCLGVVSNAHNVENGEIESGSTTDFQQRPESMISILNTEIEQPLPELGTDNGDIFIRAIVNSSFDEGYPTDETSLSYPPLSLVPSLCLNPVMSAQARLVNQSCLRMLFKDCKLRTHLSLQYRYSLLGDGVFSSRLSHALFDPDLPSAERRKGNPRFGVSGLKLGSRETWPPASSELRLALMGILSDSYYREGHVAPSASRTAELPGGLSFAIRAMSEDDLQKCMDPNSIFALDFLRLQYKPPPPLDALITQSSLEKYDTIFRLLLLMMRMLHAVKGISRGNVSSSAISDRSSVRQRFGIEAFHFISSVGSYFFEGINELWAAFKQRVKLLENRTERYQLDEHDGIDGFREMHERMLNSMMLALFLRKRHVTIMGLLQEIFTLVLDFSHRIRTEGISEGHHRSDAEDLKELYRKWSKKVKVFVSVCRGLSERKGAKDSTKLGNGEQENDLGKLLLKLDMCGYYTRRKN